MSFHTVVIDAQLEPAKVKFHSVQPQSYVERYWLGKVEENRDIIDESFKNYSSLYTIANGPHTETSSNAVLQAFVSAYNQHHDIVLSPDDMWMVVCMKFAEYVNKNSEQLRSLFVEHEEGKIKLTVQDFQSENQWDHFFDAMKVEIAKNTKGDVCRVLTADFTTTGKVESILSTACIMHAFKPYFDYNRMMCICGIRQVHFMGTLADWQSLYAKTQQLQLFSNGEFRTYIEGVLPIFKEFIQTYQGNVNNEFWIKICDITRDMGLDYGGGGSGKLITGWILQLFGLKAGDIRDPDDIKLPNIRVPVKLEDEKSGKVTQCYIVGGFHGIYSTENRHKPVMSLSVIQEIQPSMSKEEMSAKDKGGHYGYI
ncbi:unnamed protein product [Adineta steineri]|uniref:Uncharacterized protein n=1 Tax=Adineta steineri TaxID=433720 RepID=A0A815H3U3_9BILA|nr:unnamed protein product [Adineta steineri]CAF1346407.1 unnamed protein product [Adineta steineri]